MLVKIADDLQGYELDHNQYAGRIVIDIPAPGGNETTRHLAAHYFALLAAMVSGATAILDEAEKTL